jgi:hypothetical protein
MQGSNHWRGTLAGNNSAFFQKPNYHPIFRALAIAFGSKSYGFICQENAI